MKLWSIWDEARYSYFRANSFLVSSWEHVDPDYEDAYRWIAHLVPRRCIDGVPDGAELRPPVWSWAIYGDVNNPAPDLTDGWHLPPGTAGYCVELSIPKEEVVLSQFNMWVGALNGGAITSDEVEYDEWEAATAALSPSEQRRRNRETWPRMLDLDFGSDDDWGPKAERQVQACIDCIVVADVIAVQQFTAQ